MLYVGFELGMMLVDIVEMYVDGGVEEVVGEVLVGCCDEVFVVSKVLLFYVFCFGMIVVCECSLKCLGIDWIDFYLLYW